MFFKKKKKYQMNIQQADTALQNIFAACEQKPNTVPFDKLLLRQKLNTRIYDRLLILTGLLLLCTFLSPLAVAPVSSLFSGKPVAKVELVSDTMTDGVLCLAFSGEGVLYEQAYQELPDGTKEAPLYYDEKTFTIYFTYHELETNIYIPVENQAVFHILVSPN